MIGSCDVGLGDDPDIPLLDGVVVYSAAVDDLADDLLGGCVGEIVPTDTLRRGRRSNHNLADAIPGWYAHSAGVVLDAA
ncbi:hypothetical protein [Acuticoccus sp.]|uniref:hypothetical protein n=1 Tax=Acuticoccus sp. TaxID=1904378 RepID=UPI003B52AB6B